MKKQIFLVSLSIFVLMIGTAMAIENNWKPQASQGWMVMAQFPPQGSAKCTGDLSLLPESMKQLCLGEGNRAWAFLYTNFSKLDPKTGQAPTVGITLYHDLSANQYYLYCGPTLIRGFDPTAGFRPVAEGAVDATAAACLN
jgi:hypothetical protein